MREGEGETDRERGAEGGREGGKREGEQCAFHRAGSLMGMFD